MHEGVIRGIRDRVDGCRRLAAEMTDREANLILLEMADEGEAAIAMRSRPTPERSWPATSSTFGMELMFCSILIASSCRLTPFQRGALIGAGLHCWRRKARSAGP